jgi:membrane protease YdiL (CAAX protease family)
MTPQQIFFNKHGRLRSGFRFTVFLVSYIALASFLSYAFILLLSGLPVGAGQNSLVTMVGTFSIFSLTGIFLGWFYGRSLEGVPFRALGIWITKNWFINLAAGLLVGAASIGLAALIPFASGSLSFEANRTAGSSAVLLTLSVTLLLFIVGAVSEEIVFRGYLLQTMTRSKLFLVGAFLTSLLFASAHNSNPGANLFSWLNTFIAGIWFCVAYLKTRDLWFPTGIHLAWNWVQGSILGISVSGLGDLATAPLMRAEDLGPVWLTGGSYGIEGGLACTIALIISTIAVWFLPLPKPSEEMLELTGEEVRG